MLKAEGIKEENKMFKDRISAGFISGLIAGTAMNIVDWGGYLLGLYDERLLNWASIITLGRLPNTTFEVFFTQLEQILFSGFMGIPFAYVLLKLTSGNLLLKGWIYGIFVQEATYALAIALRLPNLEVHTLYATIAHLLSASIYGLALAVVLKRFEKLGA